MRFEVHKHQPAPSNPTSTDVDQTNKVDNSNPNSVLTAPVSKDAAHCNGDGEEYGEALTFRCRGGAGPVNDGIDGMSSGSVLSVFHSYAPENNTIDEEESEDAKRPRVGGVRERIESGKDVEEGLLSSASPGNSLTTLNGQADNRFGPHAAPYARIGRLYAERRTWRLVYKDGSCNVSSKNVLQRKRRYLVDLFTTFVDMRWRYNLLMFGMAFIGSWFMFSLVWWVVAVAHDDDNHFNDTAWEACVSGVYDFPTALLFSIETQHTIGYGTRSIEPRCPQAIILLMIQSCLGVFIQSLMTGLVFAKLSRPKRRAQTMIFTKKAVICQRDGEYCLLFRVGDMRKSHIISTSIRALIVKNRVTSEGESIPMCQYTLKLETEANFNDGFVFLVWPVTVVHRIDSSSPLWEVSYESLISEQFEIVVILEGIIESTGSTTQFRTSYLPTEILWGHRLTPLFTYQKTNGQYEIDFRQFHNAIPVDSMPECSAKEHQEKITQATSGTVNPTIVPYDEKKDYLASFTIGPHISHSIRQSILKLKMRRQAKMQNGAGVVDTRRSPSAASTTTDPRKGRIRHLSGRGKGSDVPDKGTTSNGACFPRSQSVSDAMELGNREPYVPPVATNIAKLPTSIPPSYSDAVDGIRSATDTRRRNRINLYRSQSTAETCPIAFGGC